MRILYVCNDLDYWLAHRAGMARAMVAAGDQVALLTGVPSADGAFPAAALGNRRLDPIPGAEAIVPGGRLRCLPLERLRLTPVVDLRLLLAVRGAVAAFRPDVVHLLTLKPILFGGLALRSAQTPRVVATFAGLGRVFAADPPDRRQRLVVRGLRAALGSPRAVAVFENAADRDRLVAARVIPASHSAVVPGAGFDPADFPAAPMPPGPADGAVLDCLFAARMLRAKGVDAVVEAARRLRQAGAPVRVTLAGPTGDDTDSVPTSELDELQAEGVIRHLGAVPPERMADLLAAHHVLLLPTRYPEGTPRILAEAGSVGRPAIVSAHPGCTTFVRDGVEGIVLDPADGAQIATQIARLADDPDMLVRMGEAARLRALSGFTLAAVVAAYRRIYAG